MDAKTLLLHAHALSSIAKKNSLQILCKAAFLTFHSELLRVNFRVCPVVFPGPIEQFVYQCAGSKRAIISVMSPPRKVGRSL